MNITSLKWLRGIYVCVNQINQLERDGSLVLKFTTDILIVIMEGVAKDMDKDSKDVAPLIHRLN